MDTLSAGNLRSRPSFPLPTIVEVLEATEEAVTFRESGKRKRHTWPVEDFLERFPERLGHVTPLRRLGPEDMAALDAAGARLRPKRCKASRTAKFP
jgi:hypothetical protein